MNYIKNCTCNYFIILFLASNKHHIFLFEMQHLFEVRALIYKFHLKVCRLMEGGT